MNNLNYDRVFKRCLLNRKRLIVCLALLWFGFCAPPQMFAHQQPTTVVLLDVSPRGAAMELQIPLSELELAFGHNATENPAALIGEFESDLNDYLLAHIRPTTIEGQPWSVAITKMKIGTAEQTQSGAYQEIEIHLLLTPPANADPRRFVLNYDAIMHQVVTHKALVGIRSDWEAGKTGEQPVTVGIIAVDTRTTQIFPLEINLKPGSNWNGFKSMVALGMRHIGEGMDHLLFLLTLLLPVMLTARNNRWTNFGGFRYSIARLFQTVTAFTVGHSITLLIGALGWLRLPAQPIEVLIAGSILISTVHAVRPVFPGKEWSVAAGFGLIHGLAFATVLANLDLGAAAMALSILGFNIGIELMQLFIIALTVPWLILLSLTPVYKWIRIGGAGFAAAAIALIAKRVSGAPNAVADFIQNNARYAHWAILALALTALSAAVAAQFNKNKEYSTEIK